MPKVIFISSDGCRQEVDAEAGASVMRAACDHGVDEILGDCGGLASCATCHVFVDAAFLSLLAPMHDTEDQMLDFTAAPRRPDSRLACQVVMNDALDGLVVLIANPQQ